MIKQVSKESQNIINLYDKSDEKQLFFFKDNTKKIIPNTDLKINEKAKLKLAKIFEMHKDKLPSKFIQNWNSVKLYDPKNSLENAHSLILHTDEGAYDLANKLNHLTGKEWTKFTNSTFIFNALPKDLREEKEICGNSQDHPATYSPTMIEGFINFFTKEGMKVLDPFSGIGSTMVACKRIGRIGYGTELNKKYYDMILKRVPEFSKNILNEDARNIKEAFKGIKFDFCISSPPYWDILNRSTDGFEKERKEKGFDVNYSDKEIDLGNIDNYDKFIEELSKIYFDIYDLLEDGAYITIIIKNIKKSGKMYPLAWDLARKLSEKYTLKDEKIWIQDKIALSPYGYPSSWASNILHHYCLILRKEIKK